MSVAILGGLDRLHRHYEQAGEELGFDVRLFGQRVPDLRKRLAGVDRIVLITGLLSHPMMHEVVRLARQLGIPVGRSHSPGVSSLKKCLEELRA